MTLSKTLLHRRPNTKELHGSHSHSDKKQLKLHPVKRRHHGPKWKSFIVTPATFAYTALLFAIIAGLELFRKTSHRSKGFPVPSEAVQTLDKFVPVVVLLFVQWIWQMYDLEIKKLAPWADMKKRARWAEDSLLLDYVGANPLSIVYQALGRRHWPVLLSLAGASLISLCIIVATSLWAIVPLPMPSQNIILHHTAALTNDNFTFPDSTAYMPRYISDVVFKRSPPKWISDGFAISSFEAKQNGTVYGNISAITSAYSGTLSCDPISVTDGKWVERSIHLENVDYLAMTYRVKASWKSCESFVDMFSYSKDFYEDPDHVSEDENVLEFVGRTQFLQCGDSKATAILVVHFTGMIADSTVGIACSPVYTHHKPLTTITPMWTWANDTSSFETITLPEGENLLRWVEQSNTRGTDWMGNELGEWFPGWHWSDETEWTNNPSVELGTWCHLISRVQALSEGDIMDPAQLISASKKVFEQLFPYIAQTGYITKLSTADSFTGSLVAIEPRLVATDTSIRILQSALVIVVFITGLLFLLHPSTHLSRDPGPLVNTAIILAENPELEDQFKNTSHMSEERLQAHLRGVHFHTKSEDGTIAVVPGGALTDTTGVITSKDEPWTPVFLHPIMKVFLVVLVGGCIATLELLFKLSKQKDGIADADSDSLLYHYSWVYAAPSILFVLGLAVKALHSVVRATYPYSQMKLESQPPRTLFFNPLFHGPYTVIPRSMRRKMYPIALSAFALLTIPAAKIVVAGIFKNEEISVNNHLHLQLLTRFGTVFSRNGKTDGVGAEFALTTLPTWGQIERPEWTTKTYAIGDIDYGLLYGETFNLTAQLPVAFADLADCRVAKSKLDFNKKNNVQGIIVDSVCGSLDLDLEINPNITYFAYVSKNETCPRVYFAYGQKLQKQSTTYNLTVLECEPTMTTSTAEVSLSMDETETAVTINKCGMDNEKDRKAVVAPYIMATAPTFQYRMGDANAPLVFNRTLDADFNLFFEIMTRTRTNGKLSDYLNHTNLQNLVQEGWRSYGSLYAHRALRIKPENETFIDTDLRYYSTRVVVNPIPARILQAILGVLLLLIAAIGFYTPRTDVLRKPPFSAGARISMLAGSNIVSMLRHAPAGEPPKTTLKGVFVKIGADRTRPNWYGIDIDANAASFDEQGVDEKGGYLDPWSPEELYYSGEGEPDEPDKKSDDRRYGFGRKKNDSFDGDYDPLLRSESGV